MAWLCFAGATGNGCTAQSKAMPPDKTKATDLVRAGSEEIMARHFERAKASFREAIEVDRSNPDAYENLSLLSLLEADDAGAEREARQLLSLDPRNYNGRLVAGVAALNQGQFFQAREVLAPLRAHAAEDALVTAAYSVALRRTGNTAQAAQLHAQLGRVSVDDRDAVLAGQIFRETQLRNEAAGWLQACVRRNGTSSSPDILYLLAGMYADQGRKQEAAKLYARILESNPENLDAQVELAEMEADLGDHQGSLQHLYEAKALSSTNPVSLLHFSQICVRRRMFVDARDALKQVVSQERENREAWYQLGLVQFRIGETDAAEKSFRAALHLDPQDKWSTIGLASILIATSRPNEADTLLQRVLADDPQCGAARYYLGEIDRGRGDFTAAYQQFQAAASDARQDARPLTALGQLQEQRHELAAAKKSFLQAIALDPASATAHYHLASLLRSEGDFEEARTQIDLFRKYHDQENKQGIVGIVRQGQWDYAGFLPSN
jgi:tetratricopeptide (TPR) repeat protein